MIDKIKNYLFPGVLVILIFLILFYIIGIFYGENSIGRLDKMTQEKIILENKIVKLKEDNKIARMELDSFTNDPEALEGYARSKFCLLYTSPSPRDPL